MKNGNCPKCNSTTIYKLQDGIGSSECQCISIGGWGKTSAKFDCYICTTCGYFENYVNDLNQLDAIANGKGNWKKIKAE
ncbi:MAG TPA: hypothetical protein VJI69_01630 [Bacteroidia bacterium]|nr:hypothetical protein [Bacteroidia bacterium]